MFIKFNRKREKERVIFMAEISFFLYRLFVGFVSISVIFLTFIQISAYQFTSQKFYSAIRQNNSSIYTEKALEYINNGQYYYSSGWLFTPWSNVDLYSAFQDFKKHRQTYPWFIYDEKFSSWSKEEQVVAHVTSWLENTLNSERSISSNPVNSFLPEEIDFNVMTVEVYFKLIIPLYFIGFTIFYYILRRNNIIRIR